ncbi:ABC transporter ATP-binding protein [Streptomyces deserti]
MLDHRPDSGTGQDDDREPTAALEVDDWAPDAADGVPSERHVFRVPHRVCAAAVSEDGSAAAFLSGLLERSRPRECVTVYGVNPQEDPKATARLVGLAPGDMPSGESSVHDTLVEAGVAHGLDRETAHERTAQLLDALELRDMEDVPAHTLPPGPRARAALGCALLHIPRLLLLCDPFEDVDDASEVVIRRVVGRFTASTGTVVFSTRSQEAADRIADHVVRIRDDRVVASYRV